MRVKVLISGLSILLVAVVSADPQTIVDSFPAPGSESRGLAWDGEYLWCADAGVDSVYKLDPLNGNILSSFPFSMDSSYGGITWSDDDNMWIANGSYVYKVDPNTGQSLFNFHCVYN